MNIALLPLKTKLTILNNKEPRLKNLNPGQVTTKIFLPNNFFDDRVTLWQKTLNIKLSFPAFTAFIQKAFTAFTQKLLTTCGGLSLALSLDPD